MYFVYMIKNDKDLLYVGISKNPETRLKLHNSNQGADFTKTPEIFKIVFKEVHETISEARKREIQIKKWRRDKKEFLIKRYEQNLPTLI